MKKILLLVLYSINCSPFTVSAQTSPWQWGRQGVGYSIHEGWATATDASGNVYATGWYHATISFGSILLTNHGGADIFLVKYSPSGVPLWAKNAGGTYDERALSVATDASGNVYVTGDFSSPQIIFGTDTLINTGNTTTSNMFVVKYSSSGSVLWTKCGEGNSYAFGKGVTTDANSNVFITGYFQSPSIVFGTNTLNTAGGKDMFIIEYDSSGTLLWAQSAGGTGDDYANAIAADASGNVFVAGYFYNASLPIGSFVLSNAGTVDVFIAKYSPAGTVLWAKGGGGAYTDYGMSVATDASGNAYVTGFYTSATISFAPQTITSAGGNDMFIVKYDSNGIVVNAKSEGTNNSEKAYSIAASASGVYVTGSFYGTSIPFGADTLLSPVGSLYPLFIVKYDLNLNVISADLLADGGYDNCAVSADGFGNAFIVSDFNSVNPFDIGTDTLSFAGANISPFFIAKYHRNMVNDGLTEVSTGDEQWIVYPNPTEGKFTIENSSAHWLTGSFIKICNVLGEEVMNEKLIMDNRKCTIDMSAKSKGIYFVEIVNSSSQVIRKKIAIN